MKQKINKYNAMYREEDNKSKKIYIVSLSSEALEETNIKGRLKEGNWI